MLCTQWVQVKQYSFCILTKSDRRKPEATSMRPNLCIDTNRWLNCMALSWCATSSVWTLHPHLNSWPYCSFLLGQHYYAGYVCVLFCQNAIWVSMFVFMLFGCPSIDPHLKKEPNYVWAVLRCILFGVNRFFCKQYWQFKRKIDQLLVSMDPG